MDSLQNLYDHHGFALWVALALVCVALAVFVFGVHLRSRRLTRRIDGLFGNLSQENMAAALIEYLGTVRNATAVVQRVKAEHDEIASLMPSVIRRVGLVRFSPFHDTGGDQSFSLALMDGAGDGVILTALHSRTDSRLYAKPIQAGSSPYSLTPEEVEAMDRAKGASPVETALR